MKRSSAITIASLIPLVFVAGICVGQVSNKDADAPVNRLEYLGANRHFEPIESANLIRSAAEDPSLARLAAARIANHTKEVNDATFSVMRLQCIQIAQNARVIELLERLADKPGHPQ